MYNSTCSGGVVMILGSCCRALLIRRCWRSGYILIIRVKKILERERRAR